MSTSIEGSKGNPFIGDVRSSKILEFGEASHNRASSSYVMENVNIAAADLSEQGGSVPDVQIKFDADVPIKFDAFGVDLFVCSPVDFGCQYLMDFTPPSSLYDDVCWLDFESQIEAKEMLGDASHNRESSEYALQNVNTLSAHSSEKGGPITQVPIDVDAIDDNVLVPSSMEFSCEMNNSQGNRERAVVIDVESETTSTSIIRSCGHPFTGEKANTVAADPGVQGGSMPHVPIDVDALDDNAPISSSLALVSAINNSRTLRENAVIIYLESEEETISTSTMVSQGQPFTGDIWNSNERDARETANIAVNSCEQGGSIPNVPIDVDAFNNIVLVSSAMAFASATNNYQMTTERAAIARGELEEQSMATSTIGSRRHPFTGNAWSSKKPRITGDVSSLYAMEYVNTLATDFRHQGGPMPLVPVDVHALDDSIPVSSSMEENIVQPLGLLPPPPPEEPNFSCPICMNSFDEPMTTRCGHIFCKECLNAAISAQKKCPTCRRKITTMRSTFRVYLPTTR